LVLLFVLAVVVSRFNLFMKKQTKWFPSIMNTFIRESRIRGGILYLWAMHPIKVFHITTEPLYSIALSFELMQICDLWLPSLLTYSHFFFSSSWVVLEKEAAIAILTMKRERKKKKNKQRKMTMMTLGQFICCKR